MPRTTSGSAAAAGTGVPSSSTAAEKAAVIRDFGPDIARTPAGIEAVTTVIVSRPWAGRRMHLHDDTGLRRVPRREHHGTGHPDTDQRKEHHQEQFPDR
ncbi:hypothetical protein ACFQZ4_29050 [Catellatospora coxensis]